MYASAIKLNVYSRKVSCGWWWMHAFCIYLKSCYCAKCTAPADITCEYLHSHTHTHAKCTEWNLFDCDNDAGKYLNTFSTNTPQMQLSSLTRLYSIISFSLSFFSQNQQNKHSLVKLAKINSNKNVHNFHVKSGKGVYKWNINFRSTTIFAMHMFNLNESAPNTQFYAFE